jgi:hypothetical protein
MAKENLIQTWNGRPVVSPDDIPDLEADAYMRESMLGNRDLAMQAAYDDYRKKHHQTAAAFHLKALKAAQASGATEEAQKHQLSYGMHLMSLKHNPYGPTPPEIMAAAQDPNLAVEYKFKAHPADSFLLAKNEDGEYAILSKKEERVMNKHEIGHELYKVLKKATEVLEGAAQPGDGVELDKSDFTDKVQAARQKEANVSRDEAGLSHHLNGDNAYARAQQDKANKLNAKNATEKARMKKDELDAGGFSTTLEGKNGANGNNGAEPKDVDRDTTLEGKNGVKKCEKKLSPFQELEKKAWEAKKKAGLVKGEFSTTLEGKDSAEPNKKQKAPDFSTTLEGKDQDKKGGKLKDVGGFSTTLEGKNGANGNNGAKLKDVGGFSTTLEGKNGANGKGGKLKDVGGFSTTLEGNDADKKGGKVKGADGFSTTLEGKDGAMQKHEILHAIYGVALEALNKANERVEHNIKISRSMGGKRFVDEQGNTYETLGEAAERLGLQASHIDEVLHGQRKEAAGHSFKYVDG